MVFLFLFFFFVFWEIINLFQTKFYFYRKVLTNAIESDETVSWRIEMRFLLLMMFRTPHSFVGVALVEWTHKQVCLVCAFYLFAKPTLVRVRESWKMIKKNWWINWRRQCLQLCPTMWFIVANNWIFLIAFWKKKALTENQHKKNIHRTLWQ